MIDEDTPRILARERRGAWHVAIATYPRNADTACGRRIDADWFSVEGNPDVFGGPTRQEFCARCVPAARRSAPGVDPSPTPSGDAPSAPGAKRERGAGSPRVPVGRGFPHVVGCAGCRAERLCNGCGAPLDDHRCTNGRCPSCHGSRCGPGGATSPGHAGWVGTREEYAAALARAAEHAATAK